jgi:hypothetical protein
MKRLLATCLSLVLVAGSQAVFADRYPHRGFGHYPRHSYHHHYRGDRGAYLLGGLLLGSALATTVYSTREPDVVYIERRYAPPPRVVYSPRVVYEEPATIVEVPAGRRLVRDLSGNCFERRFDRDGNELRVQLPASECDW